MFARLLYQSFLRQRRSKLLAGLAIALGVGVATAMLAVATDIGDKISAELRTYGANIMVTPQDAALDVQVGGVSLKPASDNAYLSEADLPKIKQTFWQHNIKSFAPKLPVPVHAGEKNISAVFVGTYFAKTLQTGKDEFTTGVRNTYPWWNVRGVWPRDNSHEVLVGEDLARKLGLSAGLQLQVNNEAVKVTGILTADIATNSQIFGSLSLAQHFAGHPDAVQSVLVSAVTKPEDDFARRDPATMSPEVYERWSCSPYANSIAHQIAEAIPHSRAEQIRQVAQNEGTVLSSISGLMMLLAAAALVASALAVSSAMATAMFERRSEIGLMKALGAGKVAIATLFFAEAAILALLGGAVGLILGAVLAEQMGKLVFDASINVPLVLLPIVLALAVSVTFVGSAASIWRALRLDSALVLRSGA